MLPDRVSNTGPLTYESGVLPIALCGPAIINSHTTVCPPVREENPPYTTLISVDLAQYKIFLVTVAISRKGGTRI